MTKLFFAPLVVLIASLAACQSPTRQEAPKADTRAVGTNRAFYHEVSTTAEPTAIWRLWTDVSTWKDWDKGLADAKLGGPFVVGATGTITPRSGPPARFDITQYEEGVSYAFETRLPLARLEVRRSFVRKDPVVIRHDVRFKGALGGFWAGRFGPSFREALPPTMNELTRLAEQKELATQEP
ncbi:MAG: SRPBCC family protein [Pseudomonadota bacterium]